MSDCQKKRNGCFLINEVEKIVRFRFVLQAINAKKEGIFSAMKCVKICQQHTLMLIHVHKNILDYINLAAVANEFADRKDSRKQTFGHFSQNCSQYK